MNDYGMIAGETLDALSHMTAEGYEVAINSAPEGGWRIEARKPGESPLVVAGWGLWELLKSLRRKVEKRTGRKARR